MRSLVRYHARDSGSANLASVPPYDEAVSMRRPPASRKVRMVVGSSLYCRLLRTTVPEPTSGKCGSGNSALASGAISLAVAPGAVGIARQPVEGRRQVCAAVFLHVDIGSV